MSSEKLLDARFRLKKIRSELNNISQIQFANELKVSIHKIKEVEAGKIRLSVETASLIEEIYGYSIRWVLTGRGEKKLLEREINSDTTDAPLHPLYNKVEPEQDYSEIVEMDLDQTPGSEIFTTRQADPLEHSGVPLCDVKLSAGGGSFVLTENIRGYYMFKNEWLHRVGTGTKNLILTFVTGDSMEPTICDRDMAMIDLGRRDIQPGKIFAVAVNSTLMIKRLFPKPGQVSLISDNRNYPHYDIKPDELRIFGQVVWFCRQLVMD